MAAILALLNAGILGVQEDIRDSTPAIAQGINASDEQIINKILASDIALNQNDVAPQPIQLDPIVRPELDAPPKAPSDNVPSKYRPSALLKAYSHALRPYMTLRTDLYENDQAFFVASPLQRGIPAGAPTFANEQLFRHANSIQSETTPIFQSNEGNYFEWLNGYVTNVQDSTEQDPLRIEKLEVDYKFYKAEAAKEYSKCLQNFKDIAAIDQSVKFLEYMDRYGSDYADACRLRDKALDALAGSDVRRAKQTFDSAQSRLELRAGSNMQCSLQDFDLIQNKPIDGASAGFIYRPLYFLSGYDTQAAYWQRLYNHDFAPKEIIVDLEEAASLNWKALGFPQFDEDPPNAPTPTLPKGCRVLLRCAGLGSFDVGRGLWNIDSFRTLLPKLLPGSEKIFKEQIHVTTRLLLAYNVNLVVQLPPATIDAMNASGLGLNLFPELLGGIPFVLGPNNELQAGIEKGSIYPILLGALTKRC